MLIKLEDFFTYVFLYSHNNFFFYFTKYVETEKKIQIIIYSMD